MAKERIGYVMHYRKRGMPHKYNPVMRNGKYIERLDLYNHLGEISELFTLDLVRDRNAVWGYTPDDRLWRIYFNAVSTDAEINSSAMVVRSVVRAIRSALILNFESEVKHFFCYFQSRVIPFFNLQRSMQFFFLASIYSDVAIQVDSGEFNNFVDTFERFLFVVWSFLYILESSCSDKFGFAIRDVIEVLVALRFFPFENEDIYRTKVLLSLCSFPRTAIESDKLDDFDNSVN